MLRYYSFLRASKLCLPVPCVLILLLLRNHWLLFLFFLATVQEGSSHELELHPCRKFSLCCTFIARQILHNSLCINGGWRVQTKLGRKEEVVVAFKLGSIPAGLRSVFRLICMALSCSIFVGAKDKRIWSFLLRSPCRRLWYAASHKFYSPSCCPGIARRQRLRRQVFILRMFYCDFGLAASLAGCQERQVGSTYVTTFLQKSLTVPTMQKKSIEKN